MTSDRTGYPAILFNAAHFCAAPPIFVFTPDAPSQNNKRDLRYIIRNCILR